MMQFLPGLGTRVEAGAGAPGAAWFGRSHFIFSSGDETGAGAL